MILLMLLLRKGNRLRDLSLKVVAVLMRVKRPEK